MEFEEIIKKFIEINEKALLQEALNTKKIEEAVLIMHPKHKRIVVESNIRSAILWHPYCPEDKVYMITDDKIKEQIKADIRRYENEY